MIDACSNGMEPHGAVLPAVESPAVQEVICSNTILFAPEVKFPVQ